MELYKAKMVKIGRIENFFEVGGARENYARVVPCTSKFSSNKDPWRLAAEKKHKR